MGFFGTVSVPKNAPRENECKYELVKPSSSASAVSGGFWKHPGVMQNPWEIIQTNQQVKKNHNRYLDCISGETSIKLATYL